MMRLVRAGIAALLLVGCVGPPVEVPSAVVDVSPTSIPACDGFATPITIDGSRSSGHLQLVPSTDDTPLAFRWTIDGAEHVIDEGAVDAPVLVVRSAGDRPLHVTLTVDDHEGGVATSTRTIAITLPDDGGIACAR